MRLVLENISHSYGHVEVLDGINLEVREGEIVAIIGPSGCGKSTLLRLAGGLEKPGSGRILEAGDPPANSLNPLTYIFQDFALLPWRSVRDNISVVLEDHRLTREHREAIIKDVLTRTNLLEFAEAWPRQLSGGMKQRVAIARALSVRPAVMLMDEPLSALDAQTRALLMEDFINLWRKEQFSALYVTHNLQEAVQLGHRIAVLSRRPGRLREIMEIEIPVQQRVAYPRELEQHRRHLWELMRDEARAADRELLNAGN